MARKKKTAIDNETLSKETEKVQEAVLKDLMSEEDTPTEKDIPDADNSVGAEVETLIVEEPVDLNEVKAEAERAEMERKKAEKAEKAKKDQLKVGDIVKLKPNVETDTLGRRIHNGIRNYTYRVLAVRPDGFISIECLTYAFLVRKDQVNKI
jgi:hypothetical protein|nr:MAG TPA: hypothetical protein [Caudoviricetes sp.]